MQEPIDNEAPPFELRAPGGGDEMIDRYRIMQEILDRNPSGVAAFSDSGECLFSNPAFRDLTLPPPLELRNMQRTSSTGVVQISQGLTRRADVKVVDLDDGFAIVTDPARDRLGIRDKALGYLLDPTSANEDIYLRAAKALGRASGWRWIGVSRFLDAERHNVRFIAWWDSAELKPHFDLNVLGAACEVAVTTEEFCYYDGQDDIRSRFPTWGMVDDYPVCSYAGFAYHVNGEAVGHIIAMNDQAGTSQAVVEDLLRLFSHFVGIHLELERQRDQTERAELEASTDKLTGLGNRLAFERKMTDMSGRIGRETMDDVLVVVADLDNLKLVNDRYGHLAGDRYLRSYAEAIRKLWRPSDDLFRIGGDEFAMLVYDISPNELALIQNRLAHAATDVVTVVDVEDVRIDVSYGFAFASEHDGDLVAAMEAADRALYAMKQAHTETASALVDTVSAVYRR